MLSPDSIPSCLLLGKGAATARPSWIHNSEAKLKTEAESSCYFIGLLSY